MAFEDDMIEEGFSSEADYLDYLFDKADDFYNRQEEQQINYSEQDYNDDCNDAYEFTGYREYDDEELEILNDERLSFRIAMDKILNKDIHTHTDGIVVMCDTDGKDYFYNKKENFYLPRSFMTAFMS